MFGGRANGLALGDTWFLALNGGATWSHLESTTDGPEPRFGASAIYDPIGDRVLLFGGIGGDDGSPTFGDTWQLSLAGDPQWTRLSLPTAPPPRCFASMVYDARRQRLVLFGGRETDGTSLRDLWFLPLGSGAGWAMGDTSGSVPIARWGASAAYDPDRDRMLLFDGTRAPCGDLDGVVYETWALDFYTPPLEPLSFRRVDSHPGDVTVEWRAPAGMPFVGLVERRTETSPWTTVGPVSLSQDGNIRFHDDAAAPGARYGYRVRWSSGTSASTTDPVWSNVPPLRLALLRPENPSTAGVRVSFSLPDGGPAKLELLDVTGRRLVSRAIGEMGPGDHVLDLATAGSLTPGIYVVRLTRGPESRAARFTVIR
jgi:hypothetical protein